MTAGQIILQDGTPGRWLRFCDPQEIVIANRLEEVLPQLQRLEAAVNEQGWTAAGYIAYEAAPAFDRAYRTHPPGDVPLLWFGLYRGAEALAHPGEAGQARTAAAAQMPADWQPSIGRTEYLRAVAAIREHIAAGESYQVNYTFRLRSPFDGDPLGLFLELATAQQGSHAAYLDTGRFAICSASPELFFRLDGRHLTTRPMKGTAPRGRTLAEDREQQRWLAGSEKNQAENVMIVDMVRNDLGRIAEAGTVRTPHLFTVERYPTLWQMTSTVTAESEASFPAILAALFPCASITGAPRIRTMQIIAGLEPEPRGVYTGCIGYLAPGRQAAFNVAIRTVVVDRRQRQAEYGLGGGIVWDSVGEEEYEECLVKARVLTARRPAFDLLETILWEPGQGYFLLDQHLTRLADSAAYFDYAFDPGALRGRLASRAANLPPVRHRVRLLLARDGAVRLEQSPVRERPRPEPLRLALALEPVNPADPMLYHKTTHRRLYEAARAARPGFDDVLLWNDRGQITESTVANVVIRLDGELVTPPLEAGLLPGVFRAWLLEQGQIRERPVRLDHLARSEQIYLINSIRKWEEATLAQDALEEIGR